MGLELIGESGGLEMSCSRCGGVMLSELAAAMAQLVCERFVIEGRYCHCDDVERPVPTNLPRENIVEELTREWCEPTTLQWRMQ